MLQDWPDDAYIAQKSDLLATALRRAGFADVALSPPARTGPGERRRMDLAARRTRSGVALGLHRQRSTEVVDLTTCLVLHPALVALMPPLRALLTRLQAFRREGSVIANLLDSGPDVLLRTDAPLQLADRIALTEFARTHALPRIAWAQGNERARNRSRSCGRRRHRSPASRSRRRPAPSCRLRHRASAPSSRRSRRTSRQGPHRRTVRRLRHAHLRTGAADTRRRVGRRCGLGIRPARRGQPGRPRRPHRGDAA